MAIVVQRDAGLTVGRLLAGVGRTHLIGRGGLLLGGTAPHTVAYSKVPAGGLALGGSGPHALPPNLVASGGLLLGGSAPHTWAARRVASGGLLLGGSAPHSYFPTQVASGGLLLGGSAPHSYFPTQVASGGLLLGGSAPHTWAARRVASGGLLLGGSGAHSYVPATVVAADHTATTVTTSGSGSAWTTVANIKLLDAVYTTCSLSGSASSLTVNMSGWSFALPVGATVVGILAKVWIFASPTPATNCFVKLQRPDGFQTSAKLLPTPLPATRTECDLGGSADLWGLSWAYTDINSSTFKVLFTCQDFSGTATTISVDCIMLSVWYH